MAPAIAVYPFEGRMVAATRVVNGVKRRGARTRSKAKANVVEDRSIPRSAAAPARAPTRPAQQLLLFNSNAPAGVGRLVSRHTGIGRVKNVTSAATRLIAPCFPGTMSRKEHSKSGDHAFGTGGSVECEDCSVNLEVSRPPSSVRGNLSVRLSAKTTMNYDSLSARRYWPSR